MSAAGSTGWHEANRRFLMEALAEVRRSLERHAARQGGPPVAGTDSPGPEEGAGLASACVPDRSVAAGLPVPTALETLCRMFGLSPFERGILLLCAGTELDGSFPSLCSAAQSDPARPWPTFSLALAALPEPHWSALSPAAPLRHWRLIEVGTGEGLCMSPLRIDERVVHYLTGVRHLDDRLAAFISPVRGTADLVLSHRAVAERLSAVWSGAAGDGLLSAVQLCGGDRMTRQAVAADACAMVGLDLHRMEAHFLPSDPRELDALIRLWDREAALSSSALLMNCEETESGDVGREAALARFVESARGALVLAGRERRGFSNRPVVTLEMGRPSAEEQRRVWVKGLGPAASTLNGEVDALVAQFDLSGPAIRAVCAETLGPAAPSGKGASRLPDDIAAALWDACRRQARPRLENLAQRITPAAGWVDLVLPEVQLRILREVALHVRHRMTVYETWGFAAKGPRGLGISALFAGASGTGKTMAAEVLAGELRLDLYRIDLSQVVNKYIGETEKNLRRVFDAAEEGGAILLFDEADALFGKRSAVKDSHDRYANIEVSYLLQRMETYRGLAILTSNMKNALDPAFLRRIRFVVEFPFPDWAQRAEIWRRIFPPDMPRRGLDPERLARLTVAGGNIRNIALHAAFLAAEAGEPVGMDHVLRAARTEYGKLERSLTEAEIRGWG